jgi:hypothetical protein
MEWSGLRQINREIQGNIGERTNHDRCEIFVRDVDGGGAGDGESLVAIDSARFVIRK